MVALKSVAGLRGLLDAEGILKSIRATAGPARKFPEC